MAATKYLFNTKEDYTGGMDKQKGYKTHKHDKISEVNTVLSVIILNIND